MPVNKNRAKKDTLEFALVELERFAVDFKTQQEFFNKHIEAAELEAAAEKAKNLFMVLRRITYANSSPEGLDEYLDEVIKITANLGEIAKNESKRFATPNEYMRLLTTSFERFANRITSKKTRERLQHAVTFIPVIDGVCASCGGIPYYFEHGNRYEKGAMILSALLLLTGLAITIAVYTSPAFIAIPFLAPVVALCVVFSRILYEQAAINAKKNFEAKPRVKASAEYLFDIEQEMRDFRQTEKSMLNFVDETFSSDAPKSRQESIKSYVNIGRKSHSYARAGRETGRQR